MLRLLTSSYSSFKNRDSPLFSRYGNFVPGLPHPTPSSSRIYRIFCSVESFQKMGQSALHSSQNKDPAPSRYTRIKTKSKGIVGSFFSSVLHLSGTSFLFYESFKQEFLSLSIGVRYDRCHIRSEIKFEFNQRDIYCERKVLS